VFVCGRFRAMRPGGEEMNETRFTVDHVCITTDRPFEDVTRAFERQLGRFDPEVSEALAAGEDAEAARAKIEGMAGPSGFMLFGTNDHGALLRLVGQKRKAVQYVVGNPLFALQMTRHDIRAGLYAPLRVLLYEDERGEACLQYDKPSSLFGQFGHAEVTAVATMLDRKLEELVAEAIR
jgi:uncharacterized protein (DUF302 family)